MDKTGRMLMYRWCLEQMLSMEYNRRRSLNKKTCNCNSCPLCYAKRALDYDFSGEEYLDVFTEALKAVDKEELTEDLCVAVFAFRDKVATKPERSPRDRRGRTPASRTKESH